MKEFAALFTALDATNKTNAKVDILVEFFKNCLEEDKPWALYLLLGRTFKRQVSSTQVRLWAAEITDIPLWLFEESYHAVGDLSETIALLLPDVDSQNDKPLAWWISYLANFKKADEATKKELLLKAWSELNQSEKLVFNKLILGSFRIGVSHSLVTRAISIVSGVEASVIAHRLMGDWTPENLDFTELLNTETHSIQISQPYPFFLAYAVENPEDLGNPDEWQAEWKWDGIRAQVIFREGELFVWSRGEDLLTEKFPEFHILKEILPPGTVLDGEILPYINRPLTFNVLQTRIGRKNVTAKVLKESPVVLMCYDLLELNGEDVRSKPLEWRRTTLENLLKELNHPELLIPSPKVDFKTWDELAAVRTTSAQNFAEGVMIKRLNSTYQVGRKRGDWWKWKIDPYSVDAVLVYAQKGHGRRADLFTDYTFAVWKDDALVPFAKAYSGLTDKEIRQVDNFVKTNTLEKFGPVRTVKPELVFEIGFEGIQESSRHKSGVAVRFPRILRWRQDKTAEDADTLEIVKGLLQQHIAPQNS
ncbi:MAG: ATP-dependent DNA ligase [Bacteroidota bacterium]